MKARRDGRTVHVSGLPATVDGVAIPDPMTIVVRYTNDDGEPSGAKGIALDNVILPRIAAALDGGYANPHPPGYPGHPQSCISPGSGAVRRKRPAPPCNPLPSEVIEHLDGIGDELSDVRDELHEIRASLKRVHPRKLRQEWSDIERLAERLETLYGDLDFLTAWASEHFETCERR